MKKRWIILGGILVGLLIIFIKVRTEGTVLNRAHNMYKSADTIKTAHKKKHLKKRLKLPYRYI